MNANENENENDHHIVSHLVYMMMTQSLRHPSSHEQIPRSGSDYIQSAVFDIFENVNC